MAHDATHFENNMDSELKVLSYSKDKEKKRVLDGVLLEQIASQLTNCKWFLWDLILIPLSQQ